MSNMNENQIYEAIITPLLVILTIVVFIIDYILPIGTVAWVFYALIIILSLKTKKANLPFALAGLCTLLILMKLIFHSEDAVFLLRLFNRSTGVLFIWLTAWFAKTKITCAVILNERSLILEQILNDKDKMISILAHDLKSPFLGLFGYSEILLKECENKNFENVAYPARQLYALSKDTYETLNNLLEWMQLSSGRIDYSPQILSLNELVEEIMRIPLKRAFLKEITLQNNLLPDIQVYADKMLLTTMLRNLINNAIKYTYPGGQIKLTCSLTDQFVEISVADNGKGIDPALLATLFKSGAKSSEPGTQSEKGTGLGLVLCKEFAMKNHGDIWAESTPGKGSRFVFTVPLGKLRKQVSA